MDISIFKEAKMLLLDVDGVLTEGEIIYGNDIEIKKFNVKDGLGIRLLVDSGIKVGIVTARKSEALVKRCSDLGIEIIFDGITNKAGVLEKIYTDTGIYPEAMVFIGDDLPDIPLLKRIGIPVTVSDGADEVKKYAKVITSKAGGKGAVREICEAILKSQDLWSSATARFHR